MMRRNDVPVDKCPHCFLKQYCEKHKGPITKTPRPSDASGTFTKLYDEVVTKKLERFQARVEDEQQRQKKMAFWQEQLEKRAVGHADPMKPPERRNLKKKDKRKKGRKKKGKKRSRDSSSDESSSSESSDSDSDDSSSTSGDSEAEETKAKGKKKRKKKTGRKGEDSDGFGEREKASKRRKKKRSKKRGRSSSEDESVASVPKKRRAT